jgi:long-subunit fatty acid transport protein
MPLRPLVRVVPLALVVLSVAVDPVYGQSNAEVNAGIQFDFSLPGARSLGMGGAFVAVADDATAAWANPAGLKVLSRSEVSIEGRFWNYSNLVADRGHAFGPSTGIGVDTVAGIVDATTTEWAGAPSFVSFVYPSERWAIALFRHQVTNFKAAVESNGPFLDSGTDVDRVDPFRATMSLDIADYGVSAAWQLTDSLAIGGGISIYRFSIDTRTARALYLPIEPPPPSQRGAFTGSGLRFGSADFSESNVLFDIRESGDDTKAGVNAGLLYRQRRWGLGAAIRQAPSFDYAAESVVGPAGARLPAFYRVGQVLDTEDVRFGMPDTYAVGASVRPVDQWLITTEYNRVQYSQLSDRIAEVFGIEENDVARGPLIADAIRDNLKFPDANQVRVGTEYAFVGAAATVFLRLGAWIDPDHRMRFEAPNRDFGRLEVLFRPGSDEVHVAPGIGFATPRFQIDGAFDVSERVNTVSVSAVYRF